MSEQKIIAVVGATGAQGGGLVRAILADPSGGFAARAITRDPATDKAKALARGRRGRRGERGRHGGLRRAFAGAYGAFCVTFFWEHFSPEKEHAQARDMAQAAKDAGRAARDLVDARGHAQAACRSTTTACRRSWASTRCRTSTPRARPTSFFRELACRRRSCSPRSTGTTSSTSAMGPKQGPDGTLAFTLPMGDKKLPGIAAEDIGKLRLRHLQAGRDLIGKTVGIAGEHLTRREMAAALTQGAGQDGRLQRRAARGLPRASASPAPTTWATCSSSSATSTTTIGGARDLEFSRSLNPELQTFDQWLARNASRIPIEAVAG